MSLLQFKLEVMPKDAEAPDDPGAKLTKKKRRGPKHDQIGDDAPQILQTSKDIKETDVSDQVDTLIFAISCNEPFTCRLKKGAVKKVLQNAKAGIVAGVGV